VELKLNQLDYERKYKSPDETRNKKHQHKLLTVQHDLAMLGVFLDPQHDKPDIL
jgi:hypothetical protein